MTQGVKIVIPIEISVYFENADTKKFCGVCMVGVVNLPCVPVDGMLFTSLDEWYELRLTSVQYNLRKRMFTGCIEDTFHEDKPDEPGDLDELIKEWESLGFVREVEASEESTE